MNIVYKPFSFILTGCTAHFFSQENQTMSTIRNVLAVIRGSEEPDRYFIVFMAD